MSIGSFNRTVTLLSRLFNAEKSTVPIVPTAPQKPPYKRGSLQQPFERVTPESQGISGETVAAFLEELRDDPTLNLHEILILRNGKIIAEAAFGEQDIGIWKMTFSACKSVTALAIGLLLDDGRLSLDDRVVDFFPDKTTPITRLRHKDLTVRHLLTMTAGVSFNEASSAVETDWIKGFFSSQSGKTGKAFSYNSLNTYLLSAIVKRVSGEGLTAFLTPRLFAPLGITNFFWETCPEGIEKGGWGLYMLPEDMAKLGQLVLQQGRWGDTQLVSADFIRQATACQQETPEDCGGFHYGYHIWCGRETPSFLFNGMLGQNVLGFPDTGLLLVTHAGNDELFQQSRYFELVAKYFSKPFPDTLPENPQAAARLQETVVSLLPHRSAVKSSMWQRWFGKPQPALPDACYALNQMCYAVTGGAAAVGLLPVILQATQNNYAAGLSAVRFAVEKDTFYLIYDEQGEQHKVALGFTRPRMTELYFRGEPFCVSAQARFAENEDGETVLVVKVSFLETPCTRHIKIYFEPAGARLKQWECPAEPLLLRTVSDFKSKLDAQPLIGAAMEKLEEDYLVYKVRRTLSPEVTLSKEEPT